MKLQPKPGWFAVIRRFGTSTCHKPMIMMNHLIMASRMKRLRREQKRMRMQYSTKAKKLRLKTFKMEDQERFIKEVGGVRVDFANPKVCYLFFLLIVLFKDKKKHLIAFDSHFVE